MGRAWEGGEERGAVDEGEGETACDGAGGGHRLGCFGCWTVRVFESEEATRA